MAVELTERTPLRTKVCLVLMSGTSMDGIDAALVELWGMPEDGTNGVRFLKAYERPYPADVKMRLMSLLRPDATTQLLPLLCQLNVEIALAFADTANELICHWNEERASQGLFPRTVDLIGSHGQTVYHIPRADADLDWRTRSPLQIGDGSIIAARVGSGIPTVSQFRMADMAEGGVGAPIMPFAELFMFSKTHTGSEQPPLLFQNIGGMGHATL